MSTVVDIYNLTPSIEILNIVHQSLRRAVVSLDEDNWMFEPSCDALA